MRIISAIVPTFKKRICIHQSVIGVGCQIKYRRVQRIVQIYISSVFPVISRLLGRVLVRPTPPFSQFQPRFNGEAEKYFLFEWKRRKRRFFQLNVFDCKRQESARCHSGFTENKTHPAPFHICNQPLCILNVEVCSRIQNQGIRCQWSAWRFKCKKWGVVLNVGLQYWRSSKCWGPV